MKLLQQRGAELKKETAALHDDEANLLSNETGFNRSTAVLSAAPAYEQQFIAERIAVELGIAFEKNQGNQLIVQVMKWYANEIEKLRETVDRRKVMVSALDIEVMGLEKQLAASVQERAALNEELVQAAAMSDANLALIGDLQARPLPLAEIYRSANGGTLVDLRSLSVMMLGLGRLDRPWNASMPPGCLHWNCGGPALLWIGNVLGGLHLSESLNL